ncbi:efflux RND transporter permease subunit, partial [Prevotella copri]|uniref:efflux RND transporter permease subunit n=1 Tax=Segatella copri TaxID=165179 RepID=UPI001291AD05
GYFYREFGVTMAVSIVISAINALTLSPALCAVLLKPHEEGHEKKMSFVDRFHAGFNYQFDKITNKYKGGVKWVINHGVIAGSLVAVSIVGLVALMGTTKTGLVPDEDTGTIFACISTAPGTSQERTAEVVKQVDKMLASNPAIATRNAIMGYSFIGGAGSNQGTIIVKLKPFEERPGGFFHRIKEACTGGGIEALFVNPMEYTSVLGMIYKQTATIKDAQVLAFAPPMISGFSMQNGITMTMQDKTGGDLNKFFDNVKKFLAELNKRPEIQTAQTQYNPNYPQYMVDVDVAKTKQAGISPSSVLAVMQGYLGGLYASNFNAYGKLYRVMIQAGPESRMRPDDLSKIYVRCADGTMSPVSEFVNLKKIYGPANITRFNLFTSMDVSVTPNSGYSTGDGISEAESSNSTGLIFALCIVFVYLILSAQYESYILPLSVVLSIPFGLAGAFIFTNLFGHSNDIYMQISLIMLIGLLAKNAILIVQFALERRRTGMAIKYSAILGAGARLRPILMTSLAMVIGLLPLMFASGVGKNGNQTLGAAAVGGMLIGTICQIFVVPALFAVFQWLQEKLTPMKFEDEMNEEVAAELEQYANAAHEMKGIEKK